MRGAAAGAPLGAEQNPDPFAPPPRVLHLPARTPMELARRTARRAPPVTDQDQRRTANPAAALSARGSFK